MSGLTLYLVVLAVAGLASLRLALRLAPPVSELPAAALAATAAAGYGAAIGLRYVDGPSWLPGAAAVIGSFVVFGPLAALALVRSGRWRAGKLLATRVLAQTQVGRASLSRWLSQAALNEGDAEAAVALAPDGDPLLASYAHLLTGEWQEALREAVVSANALASEGVAPASAALPVAAKVEALIELGRLEEAEAEVRRLAELFEASRADPIAYRLLVIAQARLVAERGDLRRVRDLFGQPLVGARPAVLYQIVARAGERAGEATVAVRALQQAHAAAKGALKQRLAARLEAMGAGPETAAPAARAFVPVGTLALSAALALAYAGQVLVDRIWGQVRVLGQVFDASTLIAAYLQGLPGVPSAGAWWRHLSYAFVHGNLPHIAFNLWVLYDIGRLYERRRGWGELLAAFAVGVAGGAALTGLVQAGQPLALVGASGGVLGVAGALLADAMARRDQADRALLRSLLQWMAFMVLFSLAVPGVSLWGHVGGLLGGFSYAYLRAALPRSRALSWALGLAAAGALATSLGLGFAAVIPLLP